ncbi:MAG: CHAD domain-containing protein [Thermoplasmata archaeon]|nr:CHAD domain-containing protein [Thermoplasmata archaeon]
MEQVRPQQVIWNARNQAASTILLDETISQVVKKILRVHVRRMLASEKGVRRGDIENVHDMRVAVRRARTALRIFRGFLDPDDFRPFVRELKTLGRVLGPVRDLDVWISNARGFKETLHARARLDLDLLVQEWQAKRKKLHERAVDHLESPRYGWFTRDFAAFLNDPLTGDVPATTKKGKVRPIELRHLGPAILYERLAAIRAYEDWLDAPDIPLSRYHRFRIEVKRLRYTLEFFTDVIGPEAEPLIDSLKGLQDHLGELREAWMTANVLEKILAPDGGKKKGTVRRPGVAAYHGSRERLREELLESLPSALAQVGNPEFNRRFAAIAAAF